MGSSESKAMWSRRLSKLNARDEIPASDTEFWDALFKISDADDCYSAITPTLTRSIYMNNVNNLATLVHEIIKVIEKFVTEARGDRKVAQNYTKVMSAVRILTRIMPVIFECIRTPPKGFASSFDMDSFLFSEMRETCIYKDLVSSLMSLLFVPGFTCGILPTYSEVERALEEEGQIPKEEPILPQGVALWESGLVGKVPPGSEKADPIRVELMRCLIAIISEDLYEDPNSISTNPPGQIARYLNSQSCPYTFPLFISILNMMHHYNPSDWRVPYSGAVFSDSRGDLLRICIQFLVIMLTVIPQKIMEVTVQDKKILKTDPNEMGVFQSFVYKINSPEACSFIFQGIVQLLDNPVDSYCSKLPSSTKQIDFVSELLLVLWYFMTFNDYLVPNALLYDQMSILVEAFCFHLHHVTSTNGPVGRIFLIANMFVLLSSHRNFSIGLNRKLRRPLKLQNLPALNYEGASYGDLLVSSLLYSSRPFLHLGDPLANSLLMVLSNISPYIRSLGKTPSVKLAAFFESLAESKFVGESPATQRFLFYVLEYFNSAIQYQFLGSAHLIYSVVRHWPIFDALSQKAEASDEVFRRRQKENAEKVAKGEPLDEDDTRADPNHWLVGLPLSPILIVCRTLYPQISRAVQDGLTLDAIVAQISNSILVGLLPTPHPIFVRSFVPSESVSQWLRIFAWSSVFPSLNKPPLFDNRSIRLFPVVATDGQGQQVVLNDEAFKGSRSSAPEQETVKNEKSEASPSDGLVPESNDLPELNIKDDPDDNKV